MVENVPIKDFSSFHFFMEGDFLMECDFLMESDFFRVSENEFRGSLLIINSLVGLSSFIQVSITHYCSDTC